MPVTVKAITDILEEQFPLVLAAEWDNPGLREIGSWNQLTENILVVLDIDDEVINLCLPPSMWAYHHPSPFFLFPDQIDQL